MTRALVISTSPAVRAGLRALLAAVGDVDVIGDGPVVNPATLHDLDEAPDVVVVEVGSVEAVDDLVDALDAADVGLVVLGPPAGADRLVGLGPPFAWAYLTPAAGSAELGAAVHAVAAGLVALDPGLVGGVGRDWRVLGPTVEGPSEELTQREREVLHLVAEGLTNKAVAQRLSISDHTVKFHVASILAKLGAGSRTEAVHLAARYGLIAL
jgi:DNA-binding NarL/FixJ family response regulator